MNEATEDIIAKHNNRDINKIISYKYGCQCTF